MRLGVPDSCPSRLGTDSWGCGLSALYFKDPVSLDCDHNFCRACITQCWEGFDTDVSCPECGKLFPQRNLRLNRQLRNIVEAARELRLKSGREPEPERLCEKHKEPLKLFCKEDEIPICLVCDRSKEHRDHTVIPAEEAAEEFKVGNDQMLFLQPDKALGNSTSPSIRVSLSPRQLLSQPAVEWNEGLQIVSEFQQLRWFLEEQERLLLAQLEKLDQEIEKIQNENATKLSKEISRLSELISEMEGKCQKPVTNVTLDPDTAHPELVLSEDWKSVRRGDTRQDLPKNLERFDSERCVLGWEGFTSGRHYWEVEVVAGRCWAVGVARESVGRKGQISRSPEGGIWAVGQWWGGHFQALTSPETLLPLSRAPSRIRVCLDCDRGQVTFIDAGDETPIFTFPPGSVPGERIQPWLQVLGPGSGLRLCP
uniref:Zinc finger protein RFP-like n=1 Tax=Chelydra serpentina TaxID=8475 RepID=A0A8C3TAD6_CHESE